jgi:hypothetical protein
MLIDEGGFSAYTIVPPQYAKGPGVTFHHPAVKGDLVLRLPPSTAEWTYNMLTSVTPTYGGEVVQVLGISFDKLVLTGRFGREGPWGLRHETKYVYVKPHKKGKGHKKGKKVKRRLPTLERRVDEPTWEVRNEKFGIGLLQMTQWFKAYFSVASQGVGRDETPDTNYREEPVTIWYASNLDTLVDTGKSDATWKVYPTNFPSYRRSNENFAPEWRVECEVAEAPGLIADHEKMAAVSRLQFGDRYVPFNPFSDPAGFLIGKQKKKVLDKLKAQAIAQARQDAGDIADYYNTLLGTIATEEATELLAQGASFPHSVSQKSQKAGKKEGLDRLKSVKKRKHLTDDALRGF